MILRFWIRFIPVSFTSCKRAHSNDWVQQYFERTWKSTLRTNSETPQLSFVKFNGNWKVLDHNKTHLGNILIYWLRRFRFSGSSQNLLDPIYSTGEWKMIETLKNTWTILNVALNKFPELWLTGDWNPGNASKGSQRKKVRTERAWSGIERRGVRMRYLDHFVQNLFPLPTKSDSNTSWLSINVHLKGPFSSDFSIQDQKFNFLWFPLLLLVCHLKWGRWRNLVTISPVILTFLNTSSQCECRGINGEDPSQKV